MFHRMFVALLVVAPLAQAISPPPTNGPETAVPVANFERPENSLLTANGRVFISGGKGVYELTRNSNGGWTTTPLTLKYKTAVGFPSAVPKDNTPCGFLGLTESKGYVYALCTPNMYNAFATKYLFAMNLNGPTQMQELGTLQNIALPNGMAADSKGQLYFADSGASVPGVGGKIVRITLANATTISSQSTWLTPALKPNGVKIAEDVVYYSENPKDLLAKTSYLRKSQINADGTPGPIRTVISYNNYIDDFVLGTGLMYYQTLPDGTQTITSDRYVMAAAYNEGVIKLVNETKGTISTFGPYTFKSPTSIVGTGRYYEYLVTEAGANQVTFLRLNTTVFPYR